MELLAGAGQHQAARAELGCVSAVHLLDEYGDGVEHLDVSFFFFGLGFVFLGIPGYGFCCRVGALKR